MKRHESLVLKNAPPSFDTNGLVRSLRLCWPAMELYSKDRKKSCELSFSYTCPSKSAYFIINTP